MATTRTVVALRLVMALSTILLAASIESLYDFSMKDSTGNLVPLSALKDKPVVLVVNVASKCGYTETNYRQLQQLYDKYQASGLEVLAIPCNQFGKQEPGSNAEIQAFAKSKGATFPVLQKVKVNGPHESELFTFLKKHTPGSDGSDLRWNFSKFLVVKGVPRARYAHDVDPFSIEPDIKAALAEIESEL